MPNRSRHQATSSAPRIDYVQNSTDLLDRRPPAEGHELVCVLSGRYPSRLAGNAATGESGDVFLYPAGVHRAAQMRRDLTIRLLVLWWSPDLPGGDLVASVKLRDTNGRILTLAHWMWNLFRPGSEADQQQLCRLLPCIVQETRRLEANPIEASLVQQMIR